MTALSKLFLATVALLALSGCALLDKYEPPEYQVSLLGPPKLALPPAEIWVAVPHFGTPMRPGGYASGWLFGRDGVFDRNGKNYRRWAVSPRPRVPQDPFLVAPGMPSL